jgi:SpoVK/Ycf46/Vps4 family AAA+-type ATPase
VWRCDDSKCSAAMPSLYAAPQSSKWLHGVTTASFAAAAWLTPSFTGADLANLVNEAAIVATRRNVDAVTLDDFTVAIERIVAGLEKTLAAGFRGPVRRARTQGDS